MTREELLELLNGSTADDSSVLRITRRRRDRPRRGQRIRLWGRSGPLSAEGRSVSWERGEVAGWWTIGALREELGLSPGSPPAQDTRPGPGQSRAPTRAAQ